MISIYTHGVDFHLFLELPNLQGSEPGEVTPNVIEMNYKIQKLKNVFT